MFRQFVDFFTAVTGSARTDAKLEAGRIMRRCMIALDIVDEEKFRKLLREATEWRNIIQNAAACPDDNLPGVKSLLITLGTQLSALELEYGLREEISRRHSALIKQ